MDIDDLKSLAKHARGVSTEADADISKLVKLSETSTDHIRQEREVDPLSDQRSDDEIISRIEENIARELDFSFNDAMEAYGRVFRELSQKSIVSALPMMLRLRGRPYTLEDHFPMEPMFRTELPVQSLLRCGRQISKSTTLAAAGILQSGTTPFFNSLFVTPLYEQCRRFSSNYVRPFVVDSPIYSAIIDNKCEQSVLQRSFKNRSIMFFSYCLKDADRVRGIAADHVTIDECVTGDTLIDTPAGPVRIDEIPIGYEVYSRDSVTGERVVDRLIDKAAVDYCEVYRVTFSDKTAIVCAARHRFVGPNGKFYVQELLDDDEIANASDPGNVAGRRELDVVRALVTPDG